jgi:cell division protein FtsL
MTPPAGTAAATRTTQRAVPQPRNRSAVAGATPPRFHRRVSGPAAARALRPGASVALPLPLGARLLRGVRALPEHRLLDRIARGRAWIPVVGVLLIGIVFTQVSLLSMNASIGAAVERAASLERNNGALRAQVAQLGSRERVEAAAGDLGLVMPEAGAVRYLAAPRMGDAAAAAAAIRALPELSDSAPTAAAAPVVQTEPAQTQEPVADPPAQQQAQAPTGTSMAPTAQGVSGGGASQTAAAGQSTPAPASGGVAVAGQGQTQGQG